MPNISPELNRVIQMTCRPLAERSLFLKTVLPTAIAEIATVKREIPLTDEPIDDDRSAEGLKRFSGNDLAKAVSILEEIHETYKDDPRWGSVFLLTVRPISFPE